MTGLRWAELAPLVALTAGLLAALLVLRHAIVRTGMLRRPVLLGLLCAAMLPPLYVALVWVRVVPESYLRFGRPWVTVLGFAAMSFATLRLGGHRARQSRLRRTLADTLVGTALLASALAATSPELGSPLDRLAVIVLVDRSRSIDLVPRAEQRIARELAVAEPSMRERDLLGVVAFAADAAAEQPPRPRTAPAAPQRAALGRDGTDIAAGIKRALAEVPADSAARIVLLSDGVPTRGDALAAAAAAVASDIPVDVVALEQRALADVRVVSFRPPAQVSEHETMRLRVVVSSPAPTEVEIRLARDGTPVSRIKALVKAGEAVVPIEEQAGSAGLHRYDVEVTAADARLDASAEDNTASAFVRVRGPARALVLDGDAGKTRFVAAALRGAELEVEEGSSSALPADIGGLAGYDLVVFGDIPAHHLAPPQVSALAAYVRDLGGGLLLTGGDRSFGPGGYARTELEDVSPVSFDLKQERRRASLAEVIAIDISGSMATTVGGHTKLELANEAAARSAALLGAGDQLGVVHVGTAPNWSVSLGPVADKAGIDRAIRAVSPGGGGIMVDVALEESYAALGRAKVNLKHVLLFADGDDAENITPAVEAAVSAAQRAGITTSIVALGRGGDIPALEGLSRRGAGRFYIVEDATRLPAVFTQETILASRSALSERPFRVKRGVGHAITERVDLGAAPILQGYVVTIAKPRADVLALGPDADPVLAVWQAGLGHAAAFTSDLKDRWGASWTSWQGAARLVAQAGRFLCRRPDDKGVRLEADVAAGELHLRATVVNDDGRLSSFRRLQAAVRGPDGFARDVPLEAAGPGSYLASIPLMTPGAYVAVAKDEATSAAVATTGAVLTRGDELRPTGTDVAYLARIAELSGGRRRDTLAGIFADRGTRRYAYRDITAALLHVAAFALLFAVAARRLAIPETAWRAAQRWWRAWRAGPAVPAAPGGATAPETLAALLESKQQTRARGEPRIGATPRAATPPAPTQATAPPPAPAPSPASPAPAHGSAVPLPGWRQPPPARAPLAARPAARAPAIGAPGEPVPPSSRPLTAAEILLQRRRGRR